MTRFMAVRPVDRSIVEGTRVLLPEKRRWRGTDAEHVSESGTFLDMRSYKVSNCSVSIFIVIIKGSSLV